jgi:4-hydroxy-tetrahydrodipicolinate synthase
MHSLTGLGYIMVTPFTPDENLDEAGLRRVVDFATEAGASALVTLGIMGEAHRLTDEERDRVAGIVIDQAAGRVPVVVGCTAQSTAATTTYCHRALGQGADAAMVAPPRSRPPQPSRSATTGEWPSRSASPW